MKADINVTPLIDVLLVVLIIFMVVAPVAPRGLEASLPPRSAGPSDPAPASLVLEVRADDFALNTAPVLTLEDLERRLHAAFETRGDGTLFVRVEGDVAYERVVAAIDAAHGAGASRIGLVEEAASGRP